MGVFSSSKKRGAVARILPTAIALGGKKLDCYASNGNGRSLHNVYGRWGAKATGRVDFDEAYASDRYKRLTTEQKKTADARSVVAMTLPSSMEAAVKAKAASRASPNNGNIDLNRVRKFKGEDGYEIMLNHRDKTLARRERAEARNLKDGIRNALGSKN